MKRKAQSNNGNRDLIRYAGLGTQLLVAIGLAVFTGIRADTWLHTMPLLSCILPLLTLGAIFYKIVRDTRRNEKDK